MNTYEALYSLPKNALEKIKIGEHNIHYINDIQCITIPFQYYLMLEQNKLIAKSRKKK